MILSLTLPAATAVQGELVPSIGGDWYSRFGTGVYTIGTADELMAFAASADTFAGKTVVLTADITLNSGTASSWLTTAPSRKWTPKASFEGTFDGNGFTISGLYSAYYVDATTSATVVGGGLFQRLAGTVKNLKLVNSCIKVDMPSSVNYIGGIAGNAGNAVIHNCYVDLVMSNVNGVSAAGIVGHQFGPVTISNTTLAGTLSTNINYFGGFVGNQESNDLFLVDCLNTATITCDKTSIMAAFSDSVYKGTLTAIRCVNLGTVKDKNGLKHAIGSTLGAGLAAGVATSNSFVESAATRGAAWYTDCYTLEGTASVTYNNVRSYSTVNGLGPDPAGEHNVIPAATLTEMEKVVGVITEKDYASLAETLGPAWTLDAKGKLCLKQETDAVKTVYISDAAALKAWAADTDNNEGERIVLTANITVNESWTSKNEFAGVFDGNGYSIIGLNNAFVKTLKGEIVNLALTGGTLNVGGYTGVFASTANGARIEGCYTNAVINGTGNNLGGFVGSLAGNLTVASSQFDGQLSSKGSYVSGFVGNQESNSLILTDCLNTGSVHGDTHVSGLSEAVYGGALFATRCVNLGAVTQGNAASMATGITYTIGSSSVKGIAWLVDCYNDTSKALSNTYNLRSGATLNGLGSGNAGLATVVSVYTDGDQYDLASELGAPWQAEAEGLSLTRAASKTYTFINNASELTAWATNGSDDAGKIIVLTADIKLNDGNAADWASAAPATTWTAKANFAGVLDGNGHTISGLYGTGGFINCFYGTIKNLSITNTYFSKAGQLGAFTNRGLAGRSGSFTNCYTDAILNSTGPNVGGCMGDQKAPLTLIGCEFAGSITSTSSYVSGLVGNQQSNDLTCIDCLNSGTVVASGNMAGISDAVYGGTLTAIRCVSTGTVTNTAGTSKGSPITSTVGQNPNASGVYQNGYAWVVDCHTLSGSSSTSRWDVRKESLVNGRDLNCKSKLSTLVRSFAANEMAEIADALGDLWTIGSDGNIHLDIRRNDPRIIKITNYDELYAWASNGKTDANRVVLLLKDITANTGSASDWAENAPAKQWPSKTFSGIFEGAGHTVSGIYRYDESSSTGFVDQFQGSGAISGIRLKNSYFNGANHVGSLVGYVSGGSTVGFYNCYSNAIVVSRNNNAGGMIGDGGSSSTVFTVANCWFDGDVRTTLNPSNLNSTGRYVGGIIANMESSKLTATDCLNTGSVTGLNAAGLFSAVYGGTLTATRCVNMGKVTCIGNPADYGDGRTNPACILQYLSGNGKATLTHCYGMTGMSNLNSYAGSGGANTTGTEQAFAENEESQVLSRLGLTYWGAHWLNREEFVMAPAPFCAKLPSVETFCFADNGDGTVTLVQYNGSSTTVTIPASYEGKPVTAIGSYAFHLKSGIFKITVPEGVTAIEDYAFRDSSIASVELPASLKSIGKGAFYNVASLKSVTLPEGVSSLGESAFYSCDALTSAKLSQAVTAIPNSLFYGCKNLDAVTVSSATVSIGDNAFDGCVKLPMAAIPETVVEIGAYAFNNCVSMTDVLVSQKAETVGEGAFMNCDALTYVILSENLKVIAPETFFGCDALASVNVPAAVTEIGAYAFSQCKSLERISVPAGIAAVSAGAFSECDSLESVYLSDGLTVIESYAFFDCDALKSIQIPASMKLVDQYAFHECGALTQVAYAGDNWADVAIKVGNDPLIAATKTNVDPLPEKEEVTPPPAEIPANALSAVVNPVTAYAGKTVEVTVDLKNNPGIANLKLSLSYDREALTLVEVRNAGLIPGAFASSQSLDTDPYLMVWANASDVAANGTLVTLVFAVDENAAEGVVDVSATILEAYNAAGEAVIPGSEEGKITVERFAPGDVNGDAEINGADSILLLQYLAEWDVELEAVAADCNGDGEINGADSILLLQYLAEWDVTLG